MIMLFTHANPALVGLARSILAGEGIHCMLKNEFSTAGIPPYNLDQELWVLDEADANRAMALLADLREEPLDDGAAYTD